LSLDARGRRQEGAKTGILNGNPLHEESSEAVKFLPASFLINTILNEKKEIASFFCGDPVLAHEEGCLAFEQTHTVAIERLKDAAIVACGGHPRDVNLIQAHKAIEHASGAVREGGALIVAAECSQGIGNSSLLSWFDYTSLRSMEKGMAMRFEINGQTAHALRTKSERFEIFFLSELPSAVISRMGMRPIQNLDEEICLVERKFGKGYQGWLIPDGVTVLPKAATQRPVAG
jgi:nickel-dependent lactate racemase